MKALGLNDHMVPPPIQPHPDIFARNLQVYDPSFPRSLGQGLQALPCILKTCGRWPITGPSAWRLLAPGTLKEGD